MVVRWISLLAVVVVAGCAHGGTPHTNEEHLTAVKFEGNHNLSDGTLLNGLALHRVLDHGGSPDPYSIQLDTDRIRGEYLRKGYLDVEVDSRTTHDGNAATVIYAVQEGPQAKLRVQITGLPPDVKAETVRDQLPLEDGKPFDYDVYDEAKPKLLGVVQDAGYAHAKLDAHVIADRAGHTAIIDLVYTPGPKCTFGPIEVTGVTGELAEAARNRVTFSPGQTYSAQAIIQTQRNLYGFGRFSTVQVTPDNTDSAVVGVKVAVAEGTRHEVTLGGGFGLDPTSYEVRGRTGYSITGWPFALDTTSIELRPAYALIRETGAYEPRIRALAKLERADLFWTYTKATVEAGYNYLTVEAYTTYGPLARLGFETRLGTRRVVLRTGWSFEEDGFRLVSPLLTQPIKDELKLNTHQRVGAYTQALVIDLRDNQIEPRYGAYAELHVAEGTKFAGGNYNFVQFVPDLRGYVPLPLGAVLAARARYGAIWGDAPALERFFSGGTNSQRGFGERQLSPSITGNIVGTGTVTVPYGGTGLIDTSVEARVPITSIRKMPLAGAAFLDGGDVTDKVDQLDPTNLYWAIGAGLRLQTIVGPVRVDVGYRLNRVGDGPMDPAPGSHWAYHLAIGEAF